MDLLKKKAIRISFAALVVISVFVMVITSANVTTANALIVLKNTEGDDLGVHVSDLEAMGIEITDMDEYFVTARVTAEQVDLLKAGGYLVWLEEGGERLPAALDAGLVWLEEGEDGLTALDASAITGPVAIFQDVNPWGRPSNQNILTANNITYMNYTSAQIGAVNLSGFEKVIIASDQPTSFYTAVEANSTWFESYVNNGGILEIHAADGGWASGNWPTGALPCGFTWNHTSGDTVDIALSGHEMLTTPNNITDGELDEWGKSYNGYFIGYPAGSELILTEGNTGSANPVLIVAPYGSGSVIASGQTLESAYRYGYSNLLENVLLYKGETGTIETETIISISTDKTSYNLGEEVDVTLNINRSEEEPRAMVLELELQEPCNDPDMLYQSPSFVMPAVFQSEVTVPLKIDQSIWCSGGEYSFIATLRDPNTSDLIDSDTADFEIDDEMPSMEKMWTKKLKKFLP
jgi:hypothetical protein